MPNSNPCSNKEQNWCQSLVVDCFLRRNCRFFIRLQTATLARALFSPFAAQHNEAVQEISGLDTALNEFFLPEQIDEPKSLSLGLQASDLFHDFSFFIPRIHIYGAQAHGFLLMHILPQLRQKIQLGVRSLLSVVSGKRVCDGFLSLLEVRYVLESYSLRPLN
jgi:hypothetical protein